MPSKARQRRLQATAAKSEPGRPSVRRRQRVAGEWYRLLFELNPTPMWIFDEATLQFLAVNRAAVKLYGWSCEEFLRMTVRDIRPPQEVPKLVRKLAGQRGSQAAFLGEWRHWKKDHTLLDVEVTISCIRFQGHDARLAMVNDITARKQAEAALRESEAHVKLALRAAQAASWVWEVKPNRTIWSPEYYDLYGIKRKVEPGFQNWLACIHPDDREAVAGIVKQKLRQRATEFSFEFRIRHPARGERWIANKGRVTYNAADGQPLLATGINLDITERKRAEAELKRLNATLEERVAERTAELNDAYERHRAITDNALVGILTLDGRGIVETLNPAAVALFGYSPKEMVGRNVSQFMASPDQLPGEAFLTHYTRPDDQRFMGVGREVLGRHKDGHAMMLELTVSDFTRGGRREFIAMARDITRRKQLERELLEASERERQRLGHDLHDGLGQHLHALYYMATLLEKEMKGASPGRSREAGRLARELEHALELSRSLARGLQPVSAVPEGLMMALRDLTERTRELYRMDCHFDCRAPVLVHRHAAANHLYRIAQEAVNNAVKHGKPTRIHIKLAATPQRIILCVRDNGTGFRQNKRPARGIGLHAMQYRANAIRGSLIVQKHRQCGTEVVCTVKRQALLPQEENIK